jgi:2-oxoglutarate/2-oxoacid ferredoxin oxidoreductase subunit alpha
MRLNILIGGKAGQGINKVSQIVAGALAKYGYFTFNYRDYQSLIRGGHNFNVLSISDEWIGSHESKLDGIIALDENTLTQHKSELKKGGFTITEKGFEDLGMNLNVALAGALTKILGIPEAELDAEIKIQLKNPESQEAAKKGFESQKEKFKLKKLKNKPEIISGSEAIAKGAINSKIDLYIAYPMTPATNAMHELAKHQEENNMRVFQAENEISVASMALGSSFAGAKTFIGTSGGGFDLMSETFSLQGQSEIPLTVYLASRPGPGTGVPTYTAQSDLDIALRAGHGEFPRIVVAPGDPNEAIELTNQALYLSEKFKTLSIILSDKHLAESEFSHDKTPDEPLPIEIDRNLPQKNNIVKATSYEHDEAGNTTESAKLTEENADARVEKYEKIKQYIERDQEKFQSIKIHGNEESKNLIIGWGSTKGAIIDAMKDLDAKFLQVIYMKPMSKRIKEEIENAENIILVENNLTGQLGYTIREKTGIKIGNRLLKYDGRPWRSDELNKYLKEIL